MTEIWWAGFVGGFLWGWVVAICLLFVAGVAREWRHRKDEPRRR